MMKTARIVICIALLPLAAAFAGTLEKAGKLSLELEAVPVTTVLTMIAQQSGLNIVISGEVIGDVSMRLDDVEVKSALDAILTPAGCNYYIKDDVIVVKPIDLDVMGELVSRPITLKYLEPITAKKILESRTSAKGKIVILDKAAENNKATDTFAPNQILITDLPAVVDELAALIESVDKPERLISIEVKIIESKIDDKSKLGLAWPTSVTTTLGAGTQNISESSETGSSSETSEATLENVAGSQNLNTGTWTWGMLTVDQLKVVLDVLNQSGQSKLISDPHITTIENHEAEINVQTIIPIPTINRFTEGAATQDILTFQDEKVGISLRVTPRINEAGKITLDVFSEIQDIIGFSGPPDNQKPITSSRSIRTRATVMDGETIALGGLLKEDEIIQEQRVPLLGRIPILGRLLFTSKSKEKATTDLIILITPKIIS